MAYNQIAKCYECAKQVGIDNAMFIGFGVLLGIVRERDIVRGDDDVDMCVLSDRITGEQELSYYRMLKRYGMFDARERKAFRSSKGGFQFSLVEQGVPNDGVRFTWFTLRPTHDAPRMCHWFMFRHEGFYWWSKGNQWVDPGKFKPEKVGYDPKNTDGIALGIPERCFEWLETIKWQGMEVRVPKLCGTVLDHHYPGWAMPASTSSCHENILIVPKWTDPKHWIIKHGY